MLLAAALLGVASVPCELGTAERTTAREMAAAPDEWIGRCVQIEGFTSGYTFYQDVGGVYRYGASDARDRPNDGWLGHYFGEKGPTGAGRCGPLSQA
ncbi:MAG TPA: hypothetical protein VF548_12065 [Allosphingosinicella sp.]|jgi:hypothetical protein